MTLNEHNIEAILGSQEPFEQYIREQLRQAVRVALMKVLEEEVETVIAPSDTKGQSRGETSATGIPVEIWRRRWDTLPICLFLELVTDIKPRCLNATIGVVMIWIRPLQRCLLAA
jgi:hypothetical protein